MFNDVEALHLWTSTALLPNNKNHQLVIQSYSSQLLQMEQLSKLRFYHI